MSNRHKALIAILIVSILWGSAGLVAKILVRELNPFVITFYRFGIASLFLIPLFLKEKKPKHFWKDLIPLSLLQTANVVFFYLGISSTTANSAAVLNTATPLLTATLAGLLIHEKIKSNQLVGILIGLTGALYIVLLPILTSAQSIGGNIRGNLFIIASMVSWASFTIGMRQVTSSGKYSAIMTISMNFFVTTVICGVIAIVFHFPFVTANMMTVPYLGTLLYAAIMITLVTFSLFQWALQHLPAATASLKDYVQLIVGIALNRIFLGEIMTPSFILGSIVVLCGVFIATAQQMLNKITSRILRGWLP